MTPPPRPGLLTTGLPATGLPTTGLYVHWPYCARICPYCDFNVVRARNVDESAWAAAFEADLGHLEARFGPRRLVSLYLGGGTPGLMSAALVGRIVETADRLFGIEAGAEITLEANPNDVTEEAVASWRAAGVERLSLGVQSLDDQALGFLGRDHDAARARRAIGLALSSFERASLDLIYARPGQTPAAWKAELADILSFGPRHLSLYQLTIEPGTPFGKQAARGTLVPAPESAEAALYRLTDEMTAAAGLPAYEVSSHAVPGQEAKHNALYWQSADWLAIGPGAHGRVTTQDGRRVATEGARRVADYLALRPERRLSEEVLSAQEVSTETIAGGLRWRGGLALDRLGPAREAVEAAARPLLADGLLERDGAVLKASATGRLVLDGVTLALVSAV